MANAFLHFKSETPFELHINGEYIGLVDNIENHSIDILLNKPRLTITYTPIIKDTPTIPYTTIIENSTFIYTECKYIDVVPYPSNNYDIILKPYSYSIFTPSTLIYSTKYDNTHIQIHSTHISILKDSNIMHSIQTNTLKKAYSEVRYNSIIIESETDTEQIHLLVLDKNNLNIVFNDIVSSINDHDKSLKALSKISDLVGHGYTYDISLENNTSTKNTVYTYNNTPKSVPYIELLPLALFEAINVHNFTLAKSYMSDTMQSVKNNYFTEYFGSIDSIYYNTHYQSNSIQNYTIKSGNIYKNYNFMIANNKIQDIEQVF